MRRNLVFHFQLHKRKRIQITLATLWAFRQQRKYGKGRASYGMNSFGGDAFLHVHSLVFLLLFFYFSTLFLLVNYFFFSVSLLHLFYKGIKRRGEH